MESGLDHWKFSLNHFSKINVIWMDINIKRVNFLKLEKVMLRSRKLFHALRLGAPALGSYRPGVTPTVAGPSGALACSRRTINVH